MNEYFWGIMPGVGDTKTAILKKCKLSLPGCACITSASNVSSCHPWYLIMRLLRLLMIQLKPPFCWNPHLDPLAPMTEYYHFLPLKVSRRSLWILPLNGISLPYWTSADVKQANPFLFQKAEGCTFFDLRVMEPIQSENPVLECGTVESFMSRT